MHERQDVCEVFDGAAKQLLSSVVFYARAAWTVE